MNKHLSKSLLAAFVGTLFLSGCSSPEPEPTDGFLGRTWQVTHIYTNEVEPTLIRGEAAGAVQLVFGANSATGSTGCAPIQAVTQLSESRLTFVDVRIPNPAGANMPCTGDRAWAHERMTQLIKEGAEFELHRVNANEIVLRLQTESVDPPSLRLAAEELLPA